MNNLLFGDKESEKKLLTEISQETLDVLKSKASGFDYFRKRAKSLEEALVACILSSPEESLRFDSASLDAAPNYELEVVSIPITNSVILQVKKK